MSKSEVYGNGDLCGMEDLTDKVLCREQSNNIITRNKDNIKVLIR